MATVAARFSPRKLPRDDQGRPTVPRGWWWMRSPDGKIPPAGTYQLQLVRRGPWIPARIAWEQTRDEDGRVLDRWAPVLRFLGHAYVRTEIAQWGLGLRPVSAAEYDALCRRPLICDPEEPVDLASMEPVISC